MTTRHSKALVLKANKTSMKFLIQVITIAVCAFVISAQPNTINACINQYTTELAKYNNETDAVYQSCFAGTSSGSSSIDISSDLSNVNSLVQDVLYRLTDCAGKTTPEDIFKCYLGDFEKNLVHLGELTAQAQVDQTYVDNYSANVIQQNSCISSGILQAQSNAIDALDTLDNCLGNVNLS